MKKREIRKEEENEFGKKYQQIRRQKLKREDNTRQKNCQMLREYTRHETLVGKGCTSMQKKNHIALRDVKHDLKWEIMA